MSKEEFDKIYKKYTQTVVEAFAKQYKVGADNEFIKELVSINTRCPEPIKEHEKIADDLVNTPGTNWFPYINKHNSKELILINSITDIIRANYNEDKSIMSKEEFDKMLLKVKGMIKL